MAGRAIARQMVAGQEMPRVIAPRGAAYLFSTALAAVSLAAAGLSFFVPDVLAGPPVTQGNLRGTALVVMLLGLPSLLVSMRLASRGSARAVVVWLGSIGYLLYQAVMFVIGTPFNSLFLVYVGMLSLSIWSVVALCLQTDVVALSARIDSRLPAHGIAVYAWVLVTLNGLLWMRTIVDAMFRDDPASFLQGSGMITNPVFVQDLAVWLPLLAVSAWWLWHGRPWGRLLTGAILTMLVYEGIGVACDQWFGSMAQPGTPFASIALVPGFLALSAIGSVPLLFFYRSVDARPRRRSAEPGQLAGSGAGSRSRKVTSR